MKIYFDGFREKKQTKANNSLSLFFYAKFELKLSLSICCLFNISVHRLSFRNREYKKASNEAYHLMIILISNFLCVLSFTEKDLS